MTDVGKGVTLLLPNLTAGGAERISVLLASEFSRRGYGIDFALMRAEGELLNDIPQGGRVIDLGAKRFRNAFWPFVQYIRRERPGAILAAMWPLTGIAILAKRLSGVGCTLVAGEHINLSIYPFGDDLSGILHRRFGRRIYGWADGVVAVSDGVRTSMSATTGLDSSEVEVIYNPVRPINPNASANRDIMRVLTSDQPTIIAVGSLKNAKDFPNLIRAFSCLRQTQHARLLILGEGELRGELEALVASLGLQGSVLMPGFVPDPYPYLAHADLFVLSSALEGLPGVLIEALVAGVPVVSTDCPSGPAEILENGKYGRLVPVGDSQGLAVAMAEALDAPHDRDMLRRRGNEFSVERAADQYLALLDPGGKILAAN